MSCHVFFAACQADLIEEVNNAEHLLRIIRYKLIQRAIVRERIVIRRFRPTPLLDRLIGIHIKELCFRFAALAFRFKEPVRHELCSVPASTFSCFGIILRKVPADTLSFSFFLLKTNIWEIDHFAHFHTSFPFLIWGLFWPRTNKKVPVMRISLPTLFYRVIWWLFSVTISLLVFVTLKNHQTSPLKEFKLCIIPYQCQPC